MVTKKQKKRNVTILILVAIVLAIIGYNQFFAVSNPIRVCNGDCILKQDCNPCLSGETASNCIYTPYGISSINSYTSITAYCNSFGNPYQWSKQCTCTPSCTSNDYKACYNGDVYWYNSCGVRGSLYESCSYDCSGGVCITQTCTPNDHKECYSGNLYWYDSCGDRGSLAESCSYGCSGSQCSAQTCTQNYEKKCFNGDSYWYDSCGTLGDVAQYCDGDCINGECQIPQDCSYGQVQCIGAQYYTCSSSNTWELQGAVVGKCDVLCLADSDCAEGSSCDTALYSCVEIPAPDYLIIVLWVGGGIVVIGTLTYLLLKGKKGRRRRRR